MDSIEYLKNELNKLVKEIPYIKCIYEYNEFDSTHIVKIAPQKIFEQNENYIELESKIVDEFINKYPFEGIVFIRENDIIDISSPLYIAQGKLYELFSYYTCIDIDVNNKKQDTIDSQTFLKQPLIFNDKVFTNFLIPVKQYTIFSNKNFDKWDELVESDYEYCLAA